MRVLKVLDQTLAPRTFLVGESITLADMAVATAVLLPFKHVWMGCNTFTDSRLYCWVYVFYCFYFQALEPSDRKSLINVTRWFTTCINQPQFLNVLGQITLCEKAGPVAQKTNFAGVTKVTNTCPAVDCSNATTNGKQIISLKYLFNVLCNTKHI